MKLRNHFVIDYFTYHSLCRKMFEGCLVGSVKSISCTIAYGEETFCEVISNGDHIILPPEHQPLMNSSKTHVDENHHCNELTPATTTMMNSAETSVIDARDKEASTVQNLTQQKLSSFFNVLNSCRKFDDNLKK